MSLLWMMPAFVGNASLQTFNLTDTNIVNTVAGGAAEAGVYINGDGTVDEVTTSVSQIRPLSDWALPNGTFTSYYVRMTQTGGDALTVDAGLGTWLALTSDRHWRYSAAGIGSTLSGNFTCEIASDSGGSDIVASCDYYLYAEWDAS